MPWLTRAAHSPIGLDLGTHSFKAVQMKPAAKGWESVRSVSLPRVTPGAALSAQEIERLKDVLDRRGFYGREVVVAVPMELLLTAVLELPARAAGVPIEQIAAAEFGRVHKADSATLTMSTWELPPSARASRATYMLAVGAQSASLTAHIDLIESVGLDVLAVEEPYSAGARGCLHFAAASSGLTAVVDIGWSAATLTIMKQGTVVYTRKLADAGLVRLHAAAMEATDGQASELEHDLWRVGFGSSPQPEADHAEVLDLLKAHVSEMSGEIKKAFGYATHQYPDSPMDRVFLIGGGAAIPNIAGRIQDELGVDTVIAGVDAADGASSMVSALGLALWSEDGR
ncbi:MAG TPA: pilus assembly protein PilM [Tepidisphaeraceae bacterium]|jgi:type IV pilus assembly protein PilM